MKFIKLTGSETPFFEYYVNPAMISTFYNLGHNVTCVNFLDDPYVTIHVIESPEEIMNMIEGIER